MSARGFNSEWIVPENMQATSIKKMHRKECLGHTGKYAATESLLLLLQ